MHKHLGAESSNMRSVMLTAEFARPGPAGEDEVSSVSHLVFIFCLREQLTAGSGA